MAGPQSPQSSSTTSIPLLPPPPPPPSSSVVPSLKRESRMIGDKLVKALQLTALDTSFTPAQAATEAPQNDKDSFLQLATREQIAEIGLDQLSHSAKPRTGSENTNANGTTPQAASTDDSNSNDLDDDDSVSSSSVMRRQNTSLRLAEPPTGQDSASQNACRFFDHTPSGIDL